MKTTYKVLMLILPIFLLIQHSYAQTLNWGRLQEQDKHILNINAGWDYSTAFGVGYSYRTPIKLPAYTSIAFSLPAGKNLTDDFKFVFSERIQLMEIRHFAVVANVGGVARRYQNSNVNLFNFGSELSLQLGYYRPKWFLAANLCHDKAIVTRFKHSSAFKESFPSVKDGWYEPATGGNFSYGLQTGFSFRNSDVYFTIGYVVTDNFNTSPFVPYYTKLGYTISLQSDRQ